MLYFLLIIIAIGVLLTSEEGKGLLRLIMTLLVIGGVLYLGFWIIVIGLGLFTSYKSVIGNILITVGLCWIAYDLYGNYKQGKFSKQSIKNWWEDSWKNHKWLTIFLLAFLIFLVIILTLNWALGSGWGSNLL